MPPSEMKSGARRDLEPLTRRGDLARSEWRMILIRWVATPWAFLQVLGYSTFPYPPGVRRDALLVAASLPLGNLVVWLVHRKVNSLAQRRILALCSLALDILVASAFVWLFAFDQVSAVWAVLFIVPLEGAGRYQLSGATASWAAIAAIYVAREVWGSAHYHYRLQRDSVSFRMGIGLLIALAAGFMARDLTRQRGRLADALDDLRRVDQLRAGLVNTLAHDVRNPIHAIRGALKTLLTRGDQLDASAGEGMMRLAARQAERLERLAAELLDLARLEGGQLALDVREVPVRDAVERALSYVDPDRRIDVRVGPGLAVQADPARLEQIIVNLAANGLRYGEPPFLVEASHSNGSIRLAFRDHGPGVPPDKRAELFEPFRARTDRGSVGLGLAIVQALVDAQGGEVTYQPNEPEGACFVVTLPAVRNSSEAAERTPERTPE